MLWLLLLRHSHFALKKIHNRFFILKTNCSFYNNDIFIKSSNYVTVISPINKCYDDNLTDNTPVINIGTNENMTFKSFITLMIFYDITSEEKMELIKDLE